jgi:hypothetical protein
MCVDDEHGPLGHRPRRQRLEGELQGELDDLGQLSDADADLGDARRTRTFSANSNEVARIPCVMPISCMRPFAALRLRLERECFLLLDPLGEGELRASSRLDSYSTASAPPSAPIVTGDQSGVATAATSASPA